MYVILTGEEYENLKIEIESLKVGAKILRDALNKNDIKAALFCKLDLNKDVQAILIKVSEAISNTADKTNRFNARIDAVKEIRNIINPKFGFKEAKEYVESKVGWE
jgi:hypothetical protein